MTGVLIRTGNLGRSTKGGKMRRGLRRSQNLDLRLPASRTGRKYISVV